MEFWWRPFSIAGVLLFGSLIVWAFFDAQTAVFALFGGLLFYLFRHLWQLHHFEVWLTNPEQPLPEAKGNWEEAYHRLSTLLRKRDLRQQQVRADLEQLHHITDALPEGALILGTDNRIVWLNKAAEHHLSLSRDRDIGQFVHYLLRNSRFAEWLTLDDPAQRLTLSAPGSGGKRLSMQLMQLNGEQRMIISQDITEVDRVDTMRRDFVANVSHELRTPITVIAGFLEAFDEMDAEELEPATVKKHIGTMREQTDRIRRLLDDLLTLARLESEQENKNAAVDIPSLAKRMLEDARSLSQGTHQIDLKLDTDVRLIGNEQELYSAFSNLVSNAVRYTPEGGIITLRWSLSAHNSAEFSVTDSGEGIEAQHIPRLTERFYRVDRGRSRATGGTGLGLAIVKHILQRHQGRLRIESTLGKGSTFTALFPADRIIPAATEITSETPPTEATTTQAVAA